MSRVRLNLVGLATIRGPAKFGGLATIWRGLCPRPQRGTATGLVTTRFLDVICRNLRASLCRDRAVVDTTQIVCNRGLCNCRVPSVCLSQLSATASTCSGFAAVGPAGRRYCSIAALHSRRSAATALEQQSSQQEKRAVSRFQPL